MCIMYARVRTSPQLARLCRTRPPGGLASQVCPGGQSTYHADVRAGGYGLMPTLPRRGLGSTLQDGKNLK